MRDRDWAGGVARSALREEDEGWVTATMICSQSIFWVSQHIFSLHQSSIMSALTGKKQLCIDQNHLQPSSVYHITAVITARWDGRLVLTMYSSIFNYKEFPFSKPHFTVWVSACLDLGKTEGTPLHYRGPVIINCMLATRLIDLHFCGFSGLVTEHWILSMMTVLLRRYLPIAYCRQNIANNTL